MRLRLTASIAFAALLAPAAALADSRLSISSQTLFFRSEDAGISNTLTVDLDSRGRVHLLDESDPFGMSYPTPPCSPGRLNSAGNVIEVFCEREGFSKTTFQTGPGEDRVAYAIADLPATLEGGVGADRLTTSAAADVLAGGQGNDELDGGAGNDTLRGDEGDDVLRGGDGNDTVDTGAGADRVDSGPGDDTVRSADGVADTIECGAGIDTVNGDTLDQVSGCENVARAQIAPPAGSTSAGDTTRPALQLGGATRQRVTAKRRTVAVAVTASEAVRLDASGFLDAAGINDRLRPLTGAIDVGGGGTLLKVVLSRTQHRRVLSTLRRKRRARLQLTVSAVDGAGNTSRPRRLTVTLAR